MEIIIYDIEKVVAIAYAAFVGLIVLYQMIISYKSKTKQL